MGGNLNWYAFISKKTKFLVVYQFNCSLVKSISEDTCTKCVGKQVKIALTIILTEVSLICCLRCLWKCENSALGAVVNEILEFPVFAMKFCSHFL